MPLYGTAGDAEVASDGQNDLAHLLVFNGATWDRWRTPNKFIDVPSTAITAGTPVTVWTPAAGKKFRLMGWALSLSVAGSILFKFAAGNTLMFRTPAVAAAGVDREDWLGNGTMPGAINDALKLDATASGSVAGMVWGTEE